MNEKDVIEIIINHINQQFPRTCPNCDKPFDSLKEWLEGTTHAGDPISYDVEDKDWETVSHVGTLSLANCSCGSTIGISSKGMGLATMTKLMFWAKKETAARDLTPRELLRDIRDKIDRIILDE